MDLIFFAYANSQDHPLPTLGEEDKSVHDILSQRAFRDNHFNINRFSFATVNEIIDYLTDFKENICLFHYSGHAGKDNLLIEDQEANANGIAQLLLECPNLKLVVLNGCSTKGQVDILLNEEGDHGIPAVIATSRPIDDQAATRFAISFYKSLADHFSTIGDAFKTAMAAVKVSSDVEYDYNQHRGIKAKSTDNNQPLWGIYCRHQVPENLDWTLPGQYTKKDAFPDFKPNKHLFKNLFVNLAPYRSEIKNIFTKESQLNVRVKSIKEKDRMVLRSLPHTVSEQLRILRAEGTGESGEILFNKIGKPRLEQLVWAYHATIPLMSGRSGGLPLLPPLRTDHTSFPVICSSTHNGCDHRTEHCKLLDFTIIDVKMTTISPV